jgi:hypothetical protein
MLKVMVAIVLVACGESPNKKVREEALATMERFATDMCKCPNAACADDVNLEMTKWSTKLAKSGDSAKQVDPVLEKRSTEAMTRYVDCMTKILGVAGQAASEHKLEVE